MRYPPIMLTLRSKLLCRDTQSTAITKIRHEDGITYQRGESVDQTVIVIQSDTGGGAVWDDLPPTYSQCINSKPQSSPPLYCANNNETTKPTTTTQNGDKIIVTSLTSPNSSST